MVFNIQDILKMSVPERMLIAEAIWNSIAENEQQVELSTEIKELLEERLKLHKNNSNEGANWDDVKARIKGQINV